MKPWLRKRLKGTPWAWAESLIITSLALGISIVLYPVNAFPFEGPFPWIWLAPMLIALRYGTFQGMISLSIIWVVIIMGSWKHINDIYFRLYLLGGLVITIISGEFQTAWTDRVNNAVWKGQYSETQLDIMMKAYYINYFSSMALQDDLMIPPVTLTAVIEDLRKILLQCEGALTHESAERFLNLLAYHFSLEKATLYAAGNNENTKNKLELEPLASIGLTSPLQLDDVLVRNGLEHPGASYFAVNKLAEEELSQYVVVASLRDYEGHLLGILAVEDMLFLGINKENLGMMSTVLDYFSNDVFAARQTKVVIKAYPDCPLIFAAELLKCTYLESRLGIQSRMLGLFIKSEKMKGDAAFKLATLVRPIDHTWEKQLGEVRAYLILMPFCGEKTSNFQIAKIKESFRERYGLTVGSGNLTIEAILVSSDANQTLDAVLKAA